MANEQCTTQLPQIMSRLFNNEHYSDMKVVFPGSNRTLHLHQIIICESSEFFKLCLSHEMKELNEDAVVTMDDDDDEELMTELLKACYHLEIEMPSDKSRIVPLVQLAQKYQFHSLLPALVSEVSTVRTYAFDPAYCGTRATLSNHNRHIKKKGGSYEWNCAAMGVTQCNEFSIRLIRNCSQLMIGMAPKYNSERPFNREGNNFRTCGWYLWCNVGSLFSQNGDDNKKYLAPCYYRGFRQQQVNQDNQDKGYDMEGTVIGVKLSNTGELSFSVNGEDMGVAFTGLPNSGLYPAFDLNKDCEFEFV